MCGQVTFPLKAASRPRLDGDGSASRRNESSTLRPTTQHRLDLSSRLLTTANTETRILIWKITSGSGADAIEQTTEIKECRDGNGVEKVNATGSA